MTATAALRPSIVRRPHARRRAGRVMQIVGIVGVVAALVGTVAGYRFVGRFNGTVAESLDLTAQTVVTLERTITETEDVVVSVEGALSSAELALSDLVTAVGRSGDVVSQVDTIAGTVGPSVESAVATLDDAASVGRTIDSVLGQLDALPFGPNYDPDVPLGVQLERLSDDLEPVAQALGDSSEELGRFEESTADVEDSMRNLQASVARVNTELGESKSVLAEYRTAAERAAQLAADAQLDLDRDALWSKVMILIVGLAVAVGQIVPIWVGTELVQSAREFDADLDDA